MDGLPPAGAINTSHQHLPPHPLLLIITKTTQPGFWVPPPPLLPLKAIMAGGKTHHCPFYGRNCRGTAKKPYYCTTHQKICHIPGHSIPHKKIEECAECKGERLAEERRQRQEREQARENDNKKNNKNNNNNNGKRGDGGGGWKRQWKY
ncbi:hypothetical protein QBC44DRAFT_361674 [Cladorrhinum sp. PSN332]|nr:hypothetical protein QBC44DRAFT_361674 [Cladorrhinum sp. PSN332]